MSQSHEQKSCTSLSSYVEPPRGSEGSKRRHVLINTGLQESISQSPQVLEPWVGGVGGVGLKTGLNQALESAKSKCRM